MYLEKLTLLNFKNYPELEVQFSSKINCFTGNNGVGKTNILDAIYYLSFCKSFLVSSDLLNVKHHEKLFVINGSYQIADSVDDIHCGFEQGRGKRFKRNKKDYERLADHIGLIPLVLISPYDINLIIGGSEERRKFMDGIISQFDRQYLFDLQRYNRVLLQRNYLLKQFGKTRSIDEEVLSLYDAELAETSSYIFQKRTQFVTDIKPIFQKYFTHITSGKEEVSLGYQSSLIENDLLTLLSEARKNDLSALYTTEGIHKDELNLLLGEHPIRKLGSQGQQKSYLVALKLAQFEYIQIQCGFKPILLLDDVFDKLDSQRVEQIIKLVAQHSFGQIFITDTNPARIGNVLRQIDGEYFHFHVENSQLTRLYEEIEYPTA
ncbi:MAG TPA: DNA replication and repair protein RecF [Marinilabiliales bacterium]|nr:MAG: DNA recombination protein RecF [Bacteroidetes bacterium GWC2_40_13]OFX74186.1 MAG: DNA recombination protein RecF [Bacteroidetes bacterium GWD2_40_43]OFX92980.1 MAG: DNA recombination protein RecF [Bacteroidetes bacterium GWE2_40_63]OFY21349.1 MAG: DNA recombination protein RecF [Bacteroidetes bacterium GWF2_40_13]OFZ30977.1 MAG: DNA recombination protein RecF [Bacteroidetes bacterium RIFOXYC2_FULL_40_12]HAM98268.1 DNA replication and repair protein RecF [Marinilabiliales bacterium]